MLQVALQPTRHHVAVDRAEDQLTPAQRIGWAIRNSGKTLEAIADAIGCTHPTLSYWQTGVTDVENAKAMLLQRFADETGVEIRWILTGEGNVRRDYKQSVSPLELLARQVSAHDGPIADQAERVIRALMPEQPPDH